jgi:hypothetical protein
MFMAFHLRTFVYSLDEGETNNYLCVFLLLILKMLK